MKASNRKRRSRLHPSPVAVTLDGSLFANATMLDGAETLEAVVRRAAALGGRIFVGIELRATEAKELQRWLDDAAYERLAFTLGGRLRRTRRSAGRKRRKRDP